MGSSYLIWFFEDGEVSVVKRSSNIQGYRLKVGDQSNVQWGRNFYERLNIGRGQLCRPYENEERKTNVSSQIQRNNKQEGHEFLHVCIVQKVPFTRAIFIDRSKFCKQFLKRVTQGTFLWNYFKIWPVVSEKFF